MASGQPAFCQAGSLQALLWRCGLCRKSPISGYVGPTTLFVASVVDFVQLKFKLHPHSKISSEMN